MAINDDLFTPEVIADPYPYFRRLREEDPVHWNEKYGVWIITRYEDVVWVLRHPELFSSEVFQRDPHESYPSIQESDLEMYNFVRAFFGDFFIQHDRPEHTAMRKVVHGYFTPKSMEKWRTLVQSAIQELLDEAEAKGRMDVCLGATLARVEGQEAFKALAQRFLALRLEAETLDYQPSITFRSLKSLPVTWN